VALAILMAATDREPLVRTDPAARRAMGFATLGFGRIIDRLK
jgi:hypothetical protein